MHTHACDHPVPSQPSRRLVLKAIAGLSLATVMPALDAADMATRQLLRRIPCSGELLPAMGLGGRHEGIRQMQTSIERMRVQGQGRKQGMDLMQIHNLVDLATQLKTLRAWKAEGRIRYLGFTHYTVDSHRQLAELIKKEKPDFVQFNFSIATRDAEKNLLATAMDNQSAVIINRPFEEGDLFRTVKGKLLPSFATELGCESWAQFFLKYILGHPAVTCVIPGTREPRHLLDNMQAGTGPVPDAAMRARMAAYFDGL